MTSYIQSLKFEAFVAYVISFSILKLNSCSVQLIFSCHQNVDA